jgi:hypothetical protein
MAATATDFRSLQGPQSLLDSKYKEPTSELEPLTSSLYECAVRRCGGVQGVAKPAYLGGFLVSGLLSVAPYCVRSGIRLVSGRATATV